MVFFVIKSKVINIATPAFLWLAFASYIIFYAFNFSVSKVLHFLLFKEHMALFSWNLVWQSLSFNWNIYNLIFCNDKYIWFYFYQFILYFLLVSSFVFNIFSFSPSFGLIFYFHCLFWRFRIYNRYFYCSRFPYKLQHVYLSY